MNSRVRKKIIMYSLVFRKLGILSEGEYNQIIGRIHTFNNS